MDTLEHLGEIHSSLPYTTQPLWSYYAKAQAKEDLDPTVSHTQLHKPFLCESHTSPQERFSKTSNINGQNF